MMSSPNHDEFAHLKIPLVNILEATNNFDEEDVRVGTDIEKRYWGKLLWSGELINIFARRFKKEGDDEIQQRFWMEISLLSTLKHKNLVPFVGFCDENDEKIIIYRREINGSLSNYLSDPMSLTWVRRLEICVGVAHALSYIHYDEPRDFSVIHRDIDSNAVLLNDDWEPVLSNFDRSIKIKASERHLSFHTDKVYNNPGYTDPTYIQTKSVSHKSDIYSFGIVLFELLCGRRSIIDDQDNKYLGPVANFHYKKKILDEIIDPVLWKQMDPQSYHVFAQTAYECLKEEGSQRPDIGEVVTRLEEALKLQMQRQNAEHSIVAAEVEVKSSNHDKGSLTSISTHVDSHVTKETKSFLKDLSHLKLSWEDIASTTNYFAQKNFIKTFRFGLIYNGRLLHSKLDVILKKFYLDFVKDESKKFWTEISMLSSLEHKNLVSLIGFYEDEEDKIVIYKKEANESLEKYLGDQTLTWMQRLKICVDVAKALSYIHYDPGRDFSVIHCNIRSSKILLDDKWEPKLSGFELSLKNTVGRRHHLLLTRDIVENVYLDPKYKKTGGLTHKSDVYSFGVVLLEVLSGRSARSAEDEDEDEDEEEEEEDEDDDDDECEDEDEDNDNDNDECKDEDNDEDDDDDECEDEDKDNDNDECKDEDNDEDEDTHDEKESELEEGLLSQLAKSHLDEMIDPHLRTQMDPEAFKIFSDTASWCIKQDRAHRPYIDQVVKRLEKALELQWKHENPVKRTSSIQLKGNLEHLKIRLNDINEATKNFDDAYTIGSGGFGKVYKADLEHFDSSNSSSINGVDIYDLPRKRSTVAIKRIYNQEGEQGFIAEIETLTSCKHDNIISLLGFCYEGNSTMILVYEHASNGSLENYLGNSDKMTNLTWVQRLNICLDTAHGLNYIHNNTDHGKQKMIHRDIKSDNILLGDN